MSTELLFLILTAVLATSLWIPYIVGSTRNPYEGMEESFVRPPDQRNMLPWIHRAHRAHLNLLEQFLPFAVLVLIGHGLSVSTPLMGWLAIGFFVLRCIHAVGMITAKTQMPSRPLIFTTCWIITLVYAGLVIVNAG